jgi:prephenate dehydratase
VAYFGPPATFTHEALLTQADLASAELVPLGSITAVLETVANGEVDQGFVPIENAIEGTVSATIDGLIHDVELCIQREVVMDIHLHLMARPGVELADLTTVSSYPHALDAFTLASACSDDSNAQLARHAAECAEPASVERPRTLRCWTIGFQG